MIHRFLWKAQGQDREITLETLQTLQTQEALVIHGGWRGQKTICAVLPTGEDLEYEGFELKSSRLALLKKIGGNIEPVPYLFTKQGLYLHYDGRSYFFALFQADKTRGPEDEKYRSSMPGKVLRLQVREGEFVEAGQGLLVLEAMKMENLICAKAPGHITQIFVKESELVQADAPLLEMDYTKK